METNIKLFNNDLLFREDGHTVMKPMEDLFYNKRIVMFGLPGAFTPTCSSKQLQHMKICIIFLWILERLMTFIVYQ